MAEGEKDAAEPKDDAKLPLILTDKAPTTEVEEPVSPSATLAPPPPSIASGGKVKPKLDIYGEEDFDLVKLFKDRGIAERGGTWYFDPQDIYKELGKPEAKKTTFMGISYQISSLYGVDTLTEHFRMVIDLNVWYKIPDSDKPVYEEWRDEGTITFQSMADDSRLKVPPPVFEIRNAVEEPDFDSCRVNFFSRCWDHNNKDEDGNSRPRWAWYVTLYAQIRVTCQEEFELFRFPFTRNSLQVQLQLKHPFSKMMYVPYNSRIAMPHWTFDPPGQKGAHPVAVRGNNYKAARLPGNWKYEKHHAAIVPTSHLSTMSSGAQYSMCLITVMLKQEPGFFLYNVCLIVAALPVLAGLAIFEDRGNMWDRLSIVIALLITISAYKVSLTAWVPQKDYLTLMDWYVVIAMGMMLAEGMLLAIMKLSADSGADENVLDSIELVFVGIMEAAWVALHIIVWIFRGYFYEEWTDLFVNEANGMKEIADYTTLQNQQMKAVKFLKAEKPDPPAQKKEEVATEVPRIAGFEVEEYGITEETVVGEEICGLRNDFSLQGIVMRVKNPKTSLEFYCNKLGFVLVNYRDHLLKSANFSIYYLLLRGALSDEEISNMQDDPAYQSELGLRIPGGLTLIWEHGTESKTERVFNTGNHDFTGTRSGKPIKGGYHGVTFYVNNVKTMVRDLEREKVKIVKYPDSLPNPPTEESQLAPLADAQITDPDGYLITLIGR